MTEHKKTHKKKEHKSEHKNHKKKRVKKKHVYWGSTVIAIIILVAIALLVWPNRPVPTGEYPKFDGKYGTVNLDFYVMSKCPYGTQVENAILPVLKKLGDSVDFNLNYIAQDLGDGTFRSLHGQPEVEGNIAQLCAAKYYPQNYMDMVVCMNLNAAKIPGNWESCATDTGYAVSKLKECYEGAEGKQLHSESIKKSMAVNAQGSPTIYINDVPYQGARDSDSFMLALCAELDENHPACADFEIVEVNMIVLNDLECTSCDTERITAVTSQLFPGLKARTVAIDSAEGKELIEKWGIKVVPAYVFDPAIEETASWQDPRLQAAFEKGEEGYRLKDEASGSTHYVDEEAQKEYEKMIGLSLEDNKPQIDFFVMSFCPYGNQAEEGIAPVYDKLGNKAEFKPHYVIYSNYGGGGPDFCIADGELCSMHGIQELNQNIRETCVNKYVGIEAWFDFALAMNTECNYQNADTCWKPVAEDLGLDTAMISKCEADEGEALMRADFELNKAMQVSGSPTVFVEGQAYQGGRTPADYQAALCTAFDKAPSECAESLAATTSGSVPAGECG